MAINEGGRYLMGYAKTSTQESPLISVLIVTYNAEKYLDEALISVFNQTYKNIELIVIDGNSTDRTTQILQKYNDQIDYWLSEPDTGQSNAFNKGFETCKGDLLTWLNADELLLPSSIESVVKKFKKNRKYNWFTGGIVFTDEHLNIIRMRKGEWGGGLLRYLGVLNVYGSSTFFTKDLFLRSGGMNEDLHFTMDTDLWWRLCNMGEKFCRVNDYICLYRLHEGSKTANYIVAGRERAPEHQFEVDRLVKIYFNSGNNKAYIKFSKLVRNLLRLLSASYIISLVDSVRYRGKSSLKVFKIK